MLGSVRFSMEKKSFGSVRSGPVHTDPSIVISVRVKPIFKAHRTPKIFAPKIVVGPLRETDFDHIGIHFDIQYTFDLVGFRCRRY
jgi:hypothetical protein